MKVPAGVKQRSENVSAKAGSAIPNESDPDQSTADLTLSAGPLDDLPITMNPNDPDPTKADAPVDRLDHHSPVPANRTDACHLHTAAVRNSRPLLHGRHVSTIYLCVKPGLLLRWMSC